jgi:hypothetical protein
MKTTAVHLEDVARAARQGVVLAFAVSLLGLAVLLAAGVPAAVAGLVASGLLGIGAASGGFGLLGRIALPLRAPARRTAKARGAALESLRVPQTH